MWRWVKGEGASVGCTSYRVWAYGMSLFSAIINASLLKNVVAARPILVDSTSGVKVACSISRTR